MKNQDILTKVRMPEVSKKPRVFVSIVSHGNARHIADHLKPHTWSDYRDTITPIILSNICDNELKEYCSQHRIELLENKTQLGFGANNNRIFSHAKQQMALDRDDYFFCVNPDIITTANDILKIAQIMEENKLTVAAPDLHQANGAPDDNIRSFPKMSDIARRYLYNSSKSNAKKNLKNDEIQIVDWASGAFLCFKSRTFEDIEGFDESYYMYYEDADICRRAGKKRHPTYFIPSVTSIHIGNRESRRKLNRLLLEHLKSAIRFATQK